MLNLPPKIDLTGYIIGGIVIAYAALAKRYHGRRPIPAGRIVWIVFGILMIAGNIAQNVIEFQNR